MKVSLWKVCWLVAATVMLLPLADLEMLRVWFQITAIKCASR